MLGEVKETLLQISAKHFVAGVVLRNGIVYEAAPIVRYLLGCTEKRGRDYCQSKNWKIKDFVEK